MSLQRAQKTPAWVWWMLATPVLLGGVAWIVAAINLKPGPGRSSVGIGENGILNSGAEYTAVFDSKASFERWLDAEIAHDKQGKLELAATGGALLVPSGAKVLILDWGNARAVPISKVRILNGRYDGAAGWAVASQIRKQ